MPRPPRVCPDGVPQHIVNRGNLRAPVFREPADYLGFLAALTDAVDRTTIRLLAYCLMPNHWHLVLWPVQGCEVPAYMQVLMNAHIRDLQRRHGTAGTGHIYQGRYKNSARKNGSGRVWSGRVRQKTSTFCRRGHSPGQLSGSNKSIGHKATVLYGKSKNKSNGRIKVCVR